MAGRVSVGGNEMDLQAAFSLLEEQLEDARKLATQPIAETLERTIREISENPSERRPDYGLVSTIQQFDGSKPESLANFFQSLENVGTLSYWSDTERLSIAKLKLSGAALGFMQSEDPTRFSTYENFKTVLTERFADKAPQHCYFQQLSVIQQRKGETIEAFADRVRTLNEKTVRVTANAEVNIALRGEADRRALDAFLRGLTGSVGEHTRLKFPTTMREAITTAVAVEHLLRPAQVEIAERKVFQGEVTCFRCHKKGHISRECKEPSRTERPSNSDPKICWRCGKKGHVRRDCRVRVDESKGRGSASNGSGNGEGASGIADPAPRV